jgi:branched-chain amino acid transport system ATP-binding protein
MLSIERVEAGYGPVTVLRGLNLAVGESELLAVLGPNASGKSTLLKTLAGTVRVRSGRIWIGDRNVTNSSAAQRVRAGITLIPQGRHLFPSMSVIENLEMGAYAIRERSTIKATLEEWVDFFPELKDKLKKRGSDLSGGEQQLVAIVRGLMSKPRILLLDEPSLGVAPKILHRVGETIAAINSERGVAVVLVEQNVDYALRLAQRAVVLREGQVRLDMEAARMRDREVLAQAYFSGTDEDSIIGRASEALSPG